MKDAVLQRFFDESEEIFVVCVAFSTNHFQFLSKPFYRKVFIIQKL